MLWSRLREDYWMNKGIFTIVFTIVTVYKTVDSNLKAFCAHNVSSNMSRYSVKPIRIEYLGRVIKMNQSEGWIFSHSILMTYPEPRGRLVTSLWVMERCAGVLGNECGSSACARYLMRLHQQRRLE